MGLTLNDDEPEKNPELSFGTTVLSDRTVHKRFRLGNASSAKI